jgi:hypothetical protein
MGTHVSGYLVRTLLLARKKMQIMICFGLHKAKQRVEKI